MLVCDLNLKGGWWIMIPYPSRLDSILGVLSPVSWILAATFPHMVRKSYHPGLLAAWSLLWGVTYIKEAMFSSLNGSVLYKARALKQKYCLYSNIWIYHSASPSGSVSSCWLETIKWPRPVSRGPSAAPVVGEAKLQQKNINVKKNYKKVIKKNSIPCEYECKNYYVVLIQLVKKCNILWHGRCYI